MLCLFDSSNTDIPRPNHIPTYPTHHESSRIRANASPRISFPMSSTTTFQPSQMPNFNPSHFPSPNPLVPTFAPHISTSIPSLAPSLYPTISSLNPTRNPSRIPTSTSPTTFPSPHPNISPSTLPTTHPSPSQTLHPTKNNFTPNPSSSLSNARINPDASILPLQECTGLVLPLVEENSIPDISPESWIVVERSKYGTIKSEMCVREDHNYFIYTATLQSESFGNFLDVFMWLLRYKYNSGKVWNRLFFNVTVDDPDLIFVHQISKQANHWSNLFEVRNQWSDVTDGSEMCKLCTKWMHECPSHGFFDADFLKLFTCTIQSVMLSQWENRPDLSRTMSVYIRCGDILSLKTDRTVSLQYGFLTLQSYVNVLSRHSQIKEIKIFTPSGDERPRKDKQFKGRCKTITSGITAMLSEMYPEINVELIPGTSILNVYRYLILSEVSVCNPSTFCLWPTLAAKHGYLAKTTLFFSAEHDFPEESQAQWVPRSNFLPARNISHFLSDEQVLQVLKAH